MRITEEHLENLVLSWFAELGYTVVSGYDIAPDTPAAERADYRQVFLLERLRRALLN